jgi:hypothetical protein
MTARPVDRLGATSMHGTVRRDGDLFHVFTGERHFTLAYKDPMAHAGEAEAAGGRLTAPMPGKVVAVMAAKRPEGESKGDPLVIMEAMKMEHTIAAPADGLVEGVLYAVGDQVADGAPLLAFQGIKDHVMRILLYRGDGNTDPWARTSPRCCPRRRWWLAGGPALRLRLRRAVECRPPVCWRNWPT